jgi:hypothetical protein
MSTSTQPQLGNIVEWYAQPSGITTGIVANAPATRRVGVLNHFLASGSAVIYDADGIRAIITDPSRLTVLAPAAFAGWAIALGV